MASFPSRARFETGFDHDDPGSTVRTTRANRRRLAVFAIVFLLVAIVGLVWVWSRPAVYQATVRLNFVPASAPRTDARPGDTRFTLRDEVEFLTSRPLLAKVADRMKSALDAAGGPISDPATTLQSMVEARQVDGTNIVVLTARGGRPEVLAAVLDRLVSAYLDGLSERYGDASAGTLADAGDEARKLEQSAAAKRREVDAFRARYNIVSLERDDNQVLSEVRATTTALNAANEKVVAAESRLGALREAQAAGRSMTRARDNPTLAGLEQQAIAIRAELREVARTFTPQYMQIDPRIRALRERLGEIEQQIVVQGQASQKVALQDADEELSTSRAAAARLRQQLAATQQSVQAFSSRFNEYRAMQDELARIEQLRQKAVERQTALAAEAGARMPKVEAVEAAAVPTSPASPAYGRDAVLALLAALLAGLLAMALVELFNRPPPRPATVVVQQSWSPTPLDPRRSGAIGVDRRRDAIEHAPAMPAALAAPDAWPRELAPDEVRALYDAAGGGLRSAIVLLLAGLTRAEVVALRPADIDRAGTVRIADDGRPPIALPAAVAERLVATAAGGPTLLVGRNGSPMAEADLDAALLYAAHDAGIDGPDDVTASALRHTYVSFLVRQGIRFADLANLVGDLPADALTTYRGLVPPGPRRPVDDVDRLMPVLHDLGAA